MWEGYRATTADGQDDPRNTYTGQHPTNLLYVDEITPQSFGALIAAYEHKVFTQGVIWNLNSFDQPGVEKGKNLAVEVLKVLDGEVATKFDASTDAITTRMKEKDDSNDHD